MSKVKEIDKFRPSISSDEIFALLDIMDCARRGDQLAGLDPTLLDYYKKLRVKAFEISEGIAKSAYVATGKRKESAISLESLGSNAEEVSSFEGKYNNSAQMDDAVNDQLTWMINHPEVDSKNMPEVEEFMKGGKYYVGPESSAIGISSMQVDVSSSSTNGSDSNDGTDCFLEQEEQEDSTFELFKQL
jgi:hypothetical protein